MRANRRIAQTAIGIAALLSLRSADAAPVQLWRTFKASPATTIASGQGTSSPVVGTTGTTSSAARIIGYFTPQTLVNPGDKISLTFGVSFNDLAVMSNGGDNFRFALFDTASEVVPVTENVVGAGTTDTNAFVGYWAGVKTGSGADGSLRERTDASNNDMFANASASANLATPPIGGSNVPLAGLINGVGTPMLYAGEFTIEKTASGITLSGGFSGNGGASTFSAVEATPISLTYGAVGFLNAAGISADQVIFRNVDVTFTPVPEPTGLALAGVGGVGAWASRRRRRSE